MDLSNAKIAQLLIPVDDFESGIAFYRDVLGLPFLFAAPPQMAFFNCGGVRLLVGVLPSEQPAQRGEERHRLVTVGPPSDELLAHARGVA